MKASRPNIIFIMLDTLRPDFLRLYGGKEEHMNTVEQIGRRGTVYRNAIAPGTYTGTSHASLFLGKRVKSLPWLMKDKMKNYDQYTDPLLKKYKLIMPGQTTLAQHLSYLGYSTVLFSSNPLVSGYTGLADGFHHISYTKNIFIGNEEERNGRHFVNGVLNLVQNDSARHILVDIAHLITRAIPSRNLDELYLRLRTKMNKRLSKEYGFEGMDLGADETTSLVNNYLEVAETNPKFLFINYMEAHEGYPTERITNRYVEHDKWMYLTGMADKTDIQYMKIACEERLSYLDEKVSELISVLKNKGALDNAILIIASDHGQGFLEHDQMYHNMFPYEEITRIPLIAARFVNGRQVETSNLVDEYVSLTALHDAIIDVGYGKKDAIGQLKKEDFIFSDHNGINEVWDTYLLTKLKERSKYANAIYKAKLHYNTFSTAIYHNGYKLIHYADRKIVDELYKISIDPSETQNIIEKKKDVARNLLNADRLYV